MDSSTTIPLSRWVRLFTDTILTRGAEYCCKHSVSGLTCNEDKIEADVIGSENYHVSVHVQDGVIEKMICSCPYAVDGKHNCKHMAAVLFSAYAPDRAKQFTMKKNPLPPPPPPKPNCTRVSIRIEDEDTTVQRYCAIPIEKYKKILRKAENNQ